MAEAPLADIEERVSPHVSPIHSPRRQAPPPFNLAEFTTTPQVHPGLVHSTPIGQPSQAQIELEYKKMLIERELKEKEMTLREQRLREKEEREEQRLREEKREEMTMREQRLREKEEREEQRLREEKREEMTMRE